jgi:hypothetical protein
MTDAEFLTEVRRGLMLIMRAVMKRYGLTWRDFAPREYAVAPADPLGISGPGV